MKTLLLIITLFFLGGCFEGGVSDSVKGLAFESYQLGYAEGYFDGMDNNYRPAEMASKFKKIIEYEGE